MHEHVISGLKLHVVIFNTLMDTFAAAFWMCKNHQGSEQKLKILQCNTYVLFLEAWSRVTLSGIRLLLLLLLLFFVQNFQHDYYYYFFLLYPW